MSTCTPTLTGRILEAAYFAADKHRSQRRKDTDRTPYINHPLFVAQVLAQCGVTDEDTLIAAICHDTVEDTDCTLEELQQHFGNRVALIVNECSDDKSLDKVKRKQLQIEHASDASKSARLVKLADKFANLHDLTTTPPSHWSAMELQGYVNWAYAVFLKLRGTNDQLETRLLQIFYKWNVPKSEPELRDALHSYYHAIDNSE